jgi:hypothetical protein
VNVIVQLAPAASDAGQLCVRAKPAGTLPYAMPVAAAPPVLAMLTAWPDDVVPTFWLPKATEFGVAATVGVAAGQVEFPARYQM